MPYQVILNTLDMIKTKKFDLGIFLAAVQEKYLNTHNFQLGPNFSLKDLVFIGTVDVENLCSTIQLANYNNKETPDIYLTVRCVWPCASRQDRDNAVAGIKRTWTKRSACNIVFDDALDFIRDISVEYLENKKSEFKRAWLLTPLTDADKETFEIKQEIQNV